MVGILEGLRAKEKIAIIDLSPAVGGQIRKMDVSDIFSTISSHWKRIGAKRNRDRSDNRSGNADRESASAENRSYSILEHAQRAWIPRFYMFPKFLKIARV